MLKYVAIVSLLVQFVECVFYGSQNYTNSYHELNVQGPFQVCSISRPRWSDIKWSLSASKRSQAARHVCRSCPPRVLNSTPDGELFTISSYTKELIGRVARWPGLEQDCPVSQIQPHLNFGRMSELHTTDQELFSWQQCVLMAATLVLLIVACVLALRSPSAQWWNPFFIVAYISTSVFEYTLVRYVALREHGLAFSPLAAVCVTETMKLVITVVLCQVLRVWGQFRQVTARKGSLLGIPAAMYMFHNTMFYLIQSQVSIATYSITLEVQLVFIAILWMAVFGRMMTRVRMLACLGVFSGALLHHVGEFKGSAKMTALDFLVPLVTAVSAAFCSVVNEYVFKMDVDMDINVQNTVLYSFGIAISISCWVIYQGAAGAPISFGAFSRGMHDWLVVLVMLIRCLIGLATSRILKHIDSVGKTVACAVSGPLAISLAPFFVAEYISTYTVFSIFITYSASIVYWRDYGAEVEEKNKVLDSADEEGAVGGG